MPQQFFTVQELVDQGYTVQHARQFISREAVHVRTAKATRKARDAVKPRPKDAVTANVQSESTGGSTVRTAESGGLEDHNAQVLEATTAEAKRRFTMTPARQAALDKAHAARREQAAARRAESKRALESVSA